MDALEQLIARNIIGTSPRTVKSISDISCVMDNKSQLIEMLKENRESLNSEQLDYLQQLISLEAPLFKEDNLNRQLRNKKIFFEIAKYNLYERLLLAYRNQPEINQDFIIFNMATKWKNNLTVKYITPNNIFELLEISVSGFYGALDIDIYDSAGYNEETTEKLRHYYQNIPGIIMSPETIESNMRLAKEKMQITNQSAATILNDWGISAFEEDTMYSDTGSKRMIKILPYAHISKYNIDKV